MDKVRLILVLLQSTLQGIYWYSFTFYVTHNICLYFCILILVSYCRDFHIATAGSDKLITSNTLLVYKNVAAHHPLDHSDWEKACELTASPAPVEQIKCIKFNPNHEQVTFDGKLILLCRD